MELDNLSHRPLDTGSADIGDMERDRSPDQLNHQRPFVGAGLDNLRNTCFLNAVLQCLTHMVPLVERIFSFDHPTPCSRDTDSFCPLCALRSHVYCCIKMSGQSIRPVTFAANLNKISSYFKFGQQEDAHEFLNNLLDRLHNCCLDPSLKDRPSSWDQDSLVKQVFGGRTRSQLRCCDCGHCSDRFESLVDISLEIDSVDSLADALSSYTKVERIEDPEAKFTCEGCKAQVVMEKQLKLDQAPMVVTLQLKRFKNGLNKIDKFVEYPLQLDLSPYLSCPEDEEPSKYELYAVVVHQGSAYSGHYYCMVRSSPMAWYLMDDCVVVRVSEACVLDQQAYILFYKKQESSPWFSTFIQSLDIPYRDCEFDDSPISVLDRMDRHIFSRCSDTSSSLETLEKDKDEYPSALADSSPESTKVNAERDHTASPCRNCGPSPETAKVNAERDHATSPCRYVGPSPETAKVNEKRDHAASPCKEVGPDKSVRRRTPDRFIELFEDEPMENEKENHLISQVDMGSTSSREVTRPSLMAIKDPRINSQLGRLMRGMPISRRAGIMACLAKQQEQPLVTERKKQHPSKERRRQQQQHWDGMPASKLPSGRGLSPGAVQRGLFKYDSQSEPEFI